MRRSMDWVLLVLGSLLIRGPAFPSAAASRFLPGLPPEARMYDRPGLARYIERALRTGRWQEMAVYTNPDGSRAVRYRVAVAGIPVWRTHVVVHYDARGRVTGIFGRDLAHARLNRRLPRLTPAQAQERAAAQMNAAGLTPTLTDLDLQWFVLDRTPQTRIVAFGTGPVLRLAYAVVMWSGFRAWESVVDAETGRVLMRILRSYDYQGTIGRGKTRWYEVKVSAIGGSGAFYLVDALRPSKGTLDQNAAMETFDAQRTWCDTGCPVGSDSDNVWDQFDQVEAHARAGWVLDYLFREFGRQGLDDAWIPLAQFVRIGPRYRNAFFTDAAFPRYAITVYGDGDGVTFRSFTAGLDVIAHELGHGITAATSELIYQDEPGALNEAFSDILAVMVEFAFEPEGDGGGQADWKIGEDVTLSAFGCPALRSLAHPRGCYGQPDHYADRYTGDADNGGVHINSGIVNHAFYLLAEGGRHRRSGITVPALGRDRAFHIFWHAYLQCLFPSARFHDARVCTVAAARQLYGADAVTAVRSAWNAVGVP